MSIKKIRTIFIGTPDFAVPSLKALTKDKFFNIIAVITQTDKKAGRKQIITSPPIKTEAKKYNIPILQPIKIKDITSDIKKLKPNIVIVAAYAQLFSEELLTIPKFGFINVHGSLLPKYRGASCIQAAILNGDKETGITIMKIDAGLDSGPILAQKSIPIESNDNSESLSNKLSNLGVKMLIPIIKDYISGKIKLVLQDEKRASYVKTLKKQDGRINWKRPALELECFIRAMTPWPSAYSEVKRNAILKIIEVEHSPVKINDHKVGEIFLYDSKLTVQCGQNALIIKKLQLAGKKEMTAEEFINGYSNFIGIIL